MPYTITNTFEFQLTSLAQAAHARARALDSIAQQVQNLPTDDFPAHAIRLALAKLGLAVVPVAALDVAETCMQLAEPVDDGLSIYVDEETSIDTSEWGAALKAVREAMDVCGKKPREVSVPE